MPPESVISNLQQGQVHSFAVLHLHRISGDMQSIWKPKTPKIEQDILNYQTTLLESYGWYKVNSKHVKAVVTVVKYRS